LVVDDSALGDHSSFCRPERPADGQSAGSFGWRRSRRVGHPEQERRAWTESKVRPRSPGRPPAVAGCRGYFGDLRMVGVMARTEETHVDDLRPPVAQDAKPQSR
jgi:hypothetical protein